MIEITFEPEANKREIGALAMAVLEYANKHSYGLGECGYYFKEWAQDYTEETNENYLRALSAEAEELASVLEDFGIGG